jgi:hypothetical protein
MRRPAAVTADPWTQPLTGRMTTTRGRKDGRQSRSSDHVHNSVMVHARYSVPQSWLIGQPTQPIIDTGTRKLSEGEGADNADNR